MQPFEQAWTLLKDMTLQEQSMQNSPELYVGDNTRPTEAGMDYKYGLPDPTQDILRALAALPIGTPGQQHSAKQLERFNADYDRRFDAVDAYQRKHGLPPRNPTTNKPMDTYDGDYYGSVNDSPPPLFATDEE